MSQGQKAAEDTKGIFKGLSDATEDARKNVNSYADNLAGGNKTHESTGIHPDAKRTGEGMQKGVEGLGRKIGEMNNGQKQH
ncbi:hypothetical protein B0A50_04786 [Salinomyces thailandicus]|uniref:Uncharacterized protein n=1 Tax=Salinomyces thailandicus TaxID=706561 RepID=A0A4U0TWF4_9PEZI|nr:hypothetical protein B0A50_04786 [Salinomyces thailandica]